MKTLSVIKAVAVVIVVLGGAAAQAQRESGVDGATEGFHAITRTELENVVSVVATIPDTESTWHCIATCSMEVDFVFADVDADGRCVLRRNGVQVGGTDRRFEFNTDPEVGTTAPIHVMTTGGMPNLAAGNHTIACACARVGAEDSNFNVIDSSLSLACSDFALD